MFVRSERQTDWAAVHAINSAAFGRPAEANLVDALRQQAVPVVSLVAEVDGGVIGHILFSPVLHGVYDGLRIAALGPMAVAPAQQQNGVGSALVRAGLNCCRRAEYGAVVVVGHPEYYSRFGFSPAKRFGLKCEFDVPSEVFMALELVPDYLQGASGRIKYHMMFKEL